MDYVKILNHSYKETCSHLEQLNPIEYLADHIFDLTTYEYTVSTFLVNKCIEVCKAISDGKTFDYISNEENNLWYLTVINFPFFQEKITWGTSIRGAFWESEIVLQSTGIFIDNNQVIEMSFEGDQWIEFINAIITFKG